MQNFFDREVSDLKDTLLKMASHAEKAVRQAVEALVQRNEALALEVRRNDDIIDRFEVEVDERSVHLLAQAPLATNLRLIAVAMKISQNLERVGDEASKIAKRSIELSREVPLKQVEQIPPLANQALRLLKAALDAFVQSDPAAARAIIPQDKAIDELNRRIYRDLASLMAADTETIGRCLNLMTISKSLERIADHAKNIAEDVVYLCEAEDIRHTARAGTAPPTP
jgi:phosphate transport system protein